jgi:replicative DNA helicase
MLAPTGVGKCLGKGTKVRMYDGTLKKVEEITTGDMLMGIDGEPRVVTSTTKGTGKLYRVNQSKGMSYVVNDAHILSLKAAFSDGAVKRGDILNENVEKYMQSTKNHRRLFKGWRTGYDLKPSSYKHFYILGLWLADGNTDGSKIWVNNNDKYLIDFLSKEYEIGHKITGKGCKGYYIKNMTDHLPIRKDKHVSEDLLLSSFSQRAELLAGILDGDGYCYGAGFEIVQKRESLAAFITKLCHTLGLHVTHRHKFVNGNKYHRLFISGDFSQIPFKLSRKVPSDPYSVLSTLEIEEYGIGEYYGFTLEGRDRLFLLEDGTVTHNTTVCKEIGYELVKSGAKVGHIFLEEDQVKTQQTYLALDNNVPLPRFREDPSIVPRERLEKSYKELIDNGRTLWMHHGGKLDPAKVMHHLEWMTVKGVEYVILDHISMVFSGHQTSNERKDIDLLLTEMAAWVTESGVHAIVVSHIKRTNRPAPKDKDGTVKYPYWQEVCLDDARGSGSFEQLAWNIIAIEPERLEDGARGRIRTRVLKNREWGWLGLGDVLEMHPQTGRLQTCETYLDQEEDE